MLTFCSTKETHSSGVLTIIISKTYTYSLLLIKNIRKKDHIMKTVKSILLSSIIILSFIALIGCETESSDQISLRVTPNTARVRVRESMEFVATGFTDYTWSLLHTDIGVLSTTKGDKTVYTAVTSASNKIQVLTVTARAATTSTNTTPQPVSAEALITHY